LDAVKQFGKFVFSMADIGFQQHLPYSLRHIHWPRIQENHSSLLLSGGAMSFLLLRALTEHIPIVRGQRAQRKLAAPPIPQSPS
jgi:hypothetical protein